MVDYIVLHSQTPSVYYFRMCGIMTYMGEVIKFPDQGDKSKNKVSETNLSTHDSSVASLGKNFSIKTIQKYKLFYQILIHLYTQEMK